MMAVKVRDESAPRTVREESDSLELKRGGKADQLPVTGSTWGARDGLRSIPPTCVVGSVGLYVPIYVASPSHPHIA